MFDNLPLTQALRDKSPYPPFDDPNYEVAERLVILAHLTFNRDIWGVSEKRLKRYWEASLEHIRGSANTAHLSTWWQNYIEEMGGMKLTTDYLHEKNLLVEPQHLTPPADPAVVLRIFRQEAPYLVDRARVWNKARKETS